MIDTPEALHVVRQYFYRSLAQRIASGPPAAFSEKAWIAWQLLRALREIHAAGVCHGDIKSENVMLTSWGWVHLVDFSASYKPTYLPLDNPNAFRVYFDTTGRRRCALAPERFVESAMGAASPTGGPTPAMDVFSAGCVLAELFSDGASVLEYADLGRCGASSKFLDGVDSRVRGLVARMVREDAAGRPTAAACLDALELDTEGGCGADFDAIEAICGDWCDMTPAERVAAALERTRGLVAGAPAAAGTVNDDEEVEPMVQTSMAASVRIEDVRAVSERLTARVGEIMRDHHATSTTANIPTNIPTNTTTTDAGSRRTTPAPTRQSPPPSPSGISRFLAQVLVVVLAPLSRPSTAAAATTTAESPSRSRLLLLDRLLKLSALVGEEMITRSVILPHFVAAATDKQVDKPGEQPRVRCFAITSLPEILRRSGSDLGIIADYVMPSLSLVPNDADAAVRCAYAASIGKVLVEGTGREDRRESREEEDPDRRTEILRVGVERGVHDILVDASSLPKMAILEHLEDVACGLGPDVTREGLLPALLTLFNARQGEVRAAMYRSLDAIVSQMGLDAVPFVLPFVDRLVSGPDVASTVSGIDLLMHMVERGLLAPKDVVRVHRRVCGCARRSSQIVRSKVRELDRAASEFLGPEMAAATLDMATGGASQVKENARPRLAIAIDPTAANLDDDEDNDGSFVTPAGLACYSVDVDGDSALEHLMNNTNASALASPTLLMSPSFRRQKRDGTLGGTLDVPSFSSLSSSAFALTSDDATRVGLGHVRSGSRSASSSPVKAARPKPAGPTAPKGTLVARIPAHAKSITGISGTIGSQSTVFATCSKDGTCKLWDSRKLERDITFRARATFRDRGGQCDGRGSAYVCCTAAPAAFSSASLSSSFLAARSDGVLDAWSVERETAPAASWRLADGAAILDVRLGSCGKVCIASTAAHSISGVDPRLPDGIAWDVRVEPSLGVPTRVGTEPAAGSWASEASASASSPTPYFVSGTSRSCLTVWDTRFMLPVATWKNPAAAPIEAVELVDGSRLGGNLPASVGPVAVVACGSEEISGWDLATGACVLAMGRADSADHLGARKSSVMDTSRPAEDPVGLARQMGALELRSLSIKRTTIRAIAVVAGEDDPGRVSVLSGGSNRSISLWNPRMPHGKNVSALISSDADVSHRDTVTALRLVRGTSSGPPLLATSSADGVLNVWR